MCIHCPAMVLAVFWLKDFNTKFFQQIFFCFSKILRTSGQTFTPKDMECFILLWEHFEIWHRIQKTWKIWFCSQTEKPKFNFQLNIDQISCCKCGKFASNDR